MKTSSFIIAALIITGFLFIQGNPVRKDTQKKGSLFSTEVKKVIDNKCYGCHSVQGKSKDAKDALMWDSLPGLQKSKLVATLDDIVKVLQKNQMPPEGVVKKYPEMKLLPDESKLLQSWAISKADSLLR
jgi:cytochrome c553